MLSIPKYTKFEQIRRNQGKKNKKINNKNGTSFLFSLSFFLSSFRLFLIFSDQKVIILKKYFWHDEMKSLFLGFFLDKKTRLNSLPKGKQKKKQKKNQKKKRNEKKKGRKEKSEKDVSYFSSNRKKRRKRTIFFSFLSFTKFFQDLFLFLINKVIFEGENPKWVIVKGN